MPKFYLPSIVCATQIWGEIRIEVLLYTCTQTAMEYDSGMALMKRWIIKYILVGIEGMNILLIQQLIYHQVLLPFSSAFVWSMKINLSQIKHNKNSLLHYLLQKN